MDQLTPHLRDTLQDIRQLYHADKLLQCSRLLEPLIAHLSGASSVKSDPPVNSKHRTALRKVLETEEFKRIQTECAEVHAFKKALSLSDGWNLSYDGDETKVWYRREANTSSHSILIEGTIRAPLLNIAALLYESDLYHNLFWYVLSSTVLPVPSHATLLRRATHIEAYAPWPLYKRDVTLYAYAVDALDADDDAVLIVSRSIRDSDAILNVPEPGSRVVRAQFHNSGIEMRPVKPGETKARFLYNVDPQIGFIPIQLVNWFARFLCRWSLRILESRARDLAAVTPEYEKRMKGGAVYAHVRSRLVEYWSDKGEQWDDASFTNKRTSGENFDPDNQPAAIPKSLVASLLRGGVSSSSQNAGETISTNAEGDADNVEEQSKPRKRLSALLFGAVIY